MPILIALGEILVGRLIGERSHLCGLKQACQRLRGHGERGISVKSAYSSGLIPNIANDQFIELSEGFTLTVLFHLPSLSMKSLALALMASGAPVKHLSSPCPTTTIRPDVNGWVPPGTCGYISRPYYPSFTAALVFSAAAAAVLAVFASKIVRISRLRRRQPDLSWRNCFVLPGFAAFLSTCLLVAYVLRAFGTRYMQVPEFVAFSDTLVLVCPICQSFDFDFPSAFASLKPLPSHTYRCSDQHVCLLWYLRSIASSSCR
jgi:hypothetical protein